MTKLNPCKRAWGVLLLSAAIATAAPAQTFTTLANFNGSNGSTPFSPLIQGLDGNLYGTTIFGGVKNEGVVFSMTKSAAPAALFSFCSGTSSCLNGYQPYAGLVLAESGNFYGTTFYGGTKRHISTGGGTVFQITASGKLTRRYAFCAQTNCSDGLFPNDALVQANGADFYGTTESGGTAGGFGTVFKMTSTGSLTTLHSFASNSAEGGAPSAGLVQASDGRFYGTTSGGGANGYGGTVFRITASGALTTLYSFCALSNCADGATSEATLVQASDGDFYGTTAEGGNLGCGDTFGCGTVFKITSAGALTTLYSFCGQAHCTDGAFPTGALVQATDGNFYGTTSTGGAGNGTVFKITPAGNLTTLHSFCVQNCSDGAAPFAGMVQATDGNLYGTTSAGGVSLNNGTIFSLSAGLGPFVEALPYTGAAGKTIKILGQGLTGTTAVSFNGTSASFTVKSDTYLTATVPLGATTGFVTATTPGGVLTSNQQFRVKP